MNVERSQRWRAPLLYSLLVLLQFLIWSAFFSYFFLDLLPGSPLLLAAHYIVGFLTTVVLLAYLIPHLRRARGQSTTTHYKAGVLTASLFIVTAISALPLLPPGSSSLFRLLHIAASILFLGAIASHFAIVIKFLGTAPHLLRPALVALSVTLIFACIVAFGLGIFG